MLLQGHNKLCDCVSVLNQKRGHHQVERYRDTGTDHTKVLDQGDDILDDEELDRKTESVFDSPLRNLMVVPKEQ